MTTYVARDTRRCERVAGLAALSAVALYLGSTAVGGLIVPGYSHVADSISELTSSSGDRRFAIAWGFVAYNAAFALLGVALWRSVRHTRASGVGAALFLVIAGAGVGMVSAFPQDPRGEPLTGPGTGHVVLAGVAALGLIVAAFTWSKAFAADDAWSSLARPSWWFGWAILVLGGGGALLGALVPELFGLGERVTMVVYLTWFAWIGVHALRLARR